jgi:hypothetical protein
MVDYSSFDLPPMSNVVLQPLRCIDCSMSRPPKIGQIWVDGTRFPIAETRILSLGSDG